MSGPKSRGCEVVKPHAPQPADSRHRVQQVGETASRARRIAVAVYVLAQKLNLGAAAPGQSRHFVQNRPRRAAAFRTPGERHHAIGTTLTATFHDGDVGAVRIIAARVGRLESLPGIDGKSRDTPLAGFQFGEQLRQAIITGRAAHQADVRSAFEDSLAFLLRHAPQHGEHLALPARTLELLQAAVNFALGFVAHAAGVVDHQAGLFRRGHFAVTARGEHTGDFLGIVHIHLAPESLDVKSPHGGFLPL